MKLYYPFKTKSHRDQTNVEGTRVRKIKPRITRKTSKRRRRRKNALNATERTESKTKKLNKEAKKTLTHTQIHIKLFKEPNIVTPNKSYLNG